MCPEVILEGPPGLPPDMEVEFYIDLLIETLLVSIAPYCIISIKLGGLNT